MHVEHLKELTWESMTSDTVRPVETSDHDHEKRQIAGHLVDYVQPSRVFSDTVDLLLQPVSGELKRYTTRPYVSGPTGSGKSRFGWEAYMAVQRRAKDATVVFASCNLAKDTMETTEDFAQYLVRTCGTLQGNVPRLHSRSTISLIAVLRAWLGELSKPAMLVLHLDEFQKNPSVVLGIQRDIEVFNAEERGRHLRVLPICTGLFNHDFLTQKNPDNSDHSHAVYLGYLSKADGAPDHDKTWNIVRNATHAVLGQDVLPMELTAAPPVLAYLVEDMAGWPMGAAQLGGQLAARHELRMAANEGRAVDWSRVSFERCETGLDEVLKNRYGYGELSPAAMLQAQLAKEGIFKLIILLLSPFPVRNCTLILGKSLVASSTMPRWHPVFTFFSTPHRCQTPSLSMAYASQTSAVSVSCIWKRSRVGFICASPSHCCGFLTLPGS